MKMLVKVVDNPHLVRDTETNAVLNKDMDGLQAYKLRKKQSSKVLELEKKMIDVDIRLTRMEKTLNKILEKLK